MRSACECESRENQRFLTLPKENQFSLGLYQNPLTFLFRNPCFVLISRPAFCFVLSLVTLPRSSLITGTCSSHTSYVIRRNELAEVRKSCLYHFKYGYFSYKNASICYRRHLFSPRSHVMHVLIWIDALYFTFLGCLNKNTRPCHYKGWKSQSNVLYNYDWIRLKEESHLHLGKARQGN